ncbi:hypothetical protein CVIRNUC_003011 [Coccomyxa viridis]|uniref:Transcription factor CBF/NF-Y/archaeal histone domain-containing protein n=1 Tax=Coccomyxa viridis TaxID=1274662 RepID=A0AAV1HXE1_9CHLO|nr:hypothetical protein CVIRNUC_003011 [Coccomyxa viridis]
MDDVSLPKATIEKVAKECLPSNVRLSGPGLELLLVCCSEFVQLIASEANTISEEDKKKTLNPEHVVKALERMGFSAFSGDVSQFLEEVKEIDKKYSETKANLKSKRSEMSEEELLALQAKLFAQARGDLPADPQ